MADPIREALERAARELELVASSLTQAGWAAAGSRAMNEAHAARAALAPQPPAAATDTPLDLDALLSPEGAYQPGTGHEDGAQLVDQLEWWVPSYGCDTLNTLLDRIRSRILPHLRPPIAGIDVPGGDGDYGGLQELCEAEGVDVRIGAPLLKRARQAWKVAAQPPAAAPASDGEREEREELAQWLYRLADERTCNRRRGIRPHPSALTRAATLLRQPAPAPAAVPVAVAAPVKPSKEQLGLIYHDFCRGCELMDQVGFEDAVCAALARWGHPTEAPAPAAVPVGERPWEREGWCDVEGRCWWFNRAGIPEWQLADGGPYGDFCLPHWAIPIPQPPQGGEVQQ